MIADSKHGHPTLLACKVCCNSQGNKIHLAREMMFGLRTEFHYAECAACESVWLTDPPADLGTYYPQDYYSFDKPTQSNRVGRSIVGRLRKQRDLTYLGEGNCVGRALAHWFDNNPPLRATLKLKIPRNSRILDVGCGSGELLLRLHSLGFTSLTGLDPFILDDIHYANGVRVRKGSLLDMGDERWDVIMFHHSLEHVPNPLVTLRAATQLLTPRGLCLLRLPVVSWAWKHYGTAWVQLDPPRHFWLPTDRGMRILAKSVGLEVTKVEYDSTEIQFWGSELWSRNRALVEVGMLKPRLKSFFTQRELAEFRRNAKVFNEKGLGDSAAFVMQRASGDTCNVVSGQTEAFVIRQ